jgi:hypothetical protein
MSTLQLAANATTGQVKEISHGGRRYLVSPVVALREGILNNVYVSAAEFGKFASSWQGRPVPISHPKDDGGYTSANTPDIWANDVLGHLWNVAVADGALKGEIWIDLDKAQQMGAKAMTIVNRLRQGEPMEVSTGYFSEIDAAPGMFNGSQYAATARNIRPDHLALLPDEVGACSWADGCGTPRVNSLEVDVDDVTLFQRFLGWLKNDQSENQSPSANAEGTAADPPCSCEPVDGQIVIEANHSTEGGFSMNKTELIGALTANAKCKFAKEKLATWDEADLQVLQESLEATADGGQGTAGTETAAEAASGSQFAVPSPQSDPDLMARLARIEEMLGHVTANVNEERSGLIAAIVANCRGAWSETQLAGCDTNRLRTIYASYQPRDYSANAGALRNIGADEEELVMHWPMFEQKGA